MLANQRASIFSIHSHSNSSLFNQKQLNKKRKPKIRNSTSIDYFEILNLNEIDQKIYKLLKQYLLKRKSIIICSFIIITLISLNTSFLVIHNYDCRIFNLCSIDTNDESKPFFFWIIIGLILTLITILVFILLHLFNIKKYYSQKLINLTIIELNELRNRTYFDSTISLNSNNSSLDKHVKFDSSNSSLDHHVKFDNNSNLDHHIKFDNNLEINPILNSVNKIRPKNKILHKTLSNVSIKIENFDDKSTLNCYVNPNFKLGSDDTSQSIELSEFSTSSNSTKESSLSTK